MELNGTALDEQDNSPIAQVVNQAFDAINGNGPAGPALKALDQVIASETNAHLCDALLDDKIELLVKKRRFEDAYTTAHQVSQVDVRADQYADIGIAQKAAGQNAGKAGFLLRQLLERAGDEETQQAIAESLIRFERGEPL